MRPRRGSKTRLLAPYPSTAAVLFPIVFWSEMALKNLFGKHTSNHTNTHQRRAQIKHYILQTHTAKYISPTHSCTCNRHTHTLQTHIHTHAHPYTSNTHTLVHWQLTYIPIHPPTHINMWPTLNQPRHDKNSCFSIFLICNMWLSSNNLCQTWQRTNLIEIVEILWKCLLLLLLAVSNRRLDTSSAHLLMF